MTEGFFDAAVVGGGLGGLAAATLLARRGLRVVLLERAHELGGRAATDGHDGWYFNRGAHALYRGAAAERVLAGLGVRWSGRAPPPTGVAELEGRPHALPATMSSLLSTGLLGWSAKWSGARLFARVRSSDPRALAGTSVKTWLEANVADPRMRGAFEAFVRVTTYTNDPGHLDAGAAIGQLRLAQRTGVVYLDGGWQTLVDGTHDAARAAGVEVRTGAAVKCAARHADGWTLGVDGTEPLACRALVLATGPAAARSIVASEALASWAIRAVPTRAACLDLALSRLPDERTTFALGVDRPLYFSVHSKSARVAPDGAALVSTMKYLPPGKPADAARDLAELEAWVDRLQPGWRELVVERRWLPAMVTAQAMVTAADGGLKGRPGPRVPDAPGVFVVGDWVGGEGMLLDASLASAERAAVEAGAELGVAKVA
ncbi:MAG TPA: FAD-dependent oxidoreductase [Polyangiaceae bacterium]|jgi:phytoene dehydrogenase-like protein